MKNYDYLLGSTVRVPFIGDLCVEGKVINVEGEHGTIFCTDQEGFPEGCEFEVNGGGCTVFDAPWRDDFKTSACPTTNFSVVCAKDPIPDYGYYRLEIVHVRHWNGQGFTPRMYSAIDGHWMAGGPVFQNYGEAVAAAFAMRAKEEAEFKAWFAANEKRTAEFRESKLDQKLENWAARWDDKVPGRGRFKEN